MPKLLYQYLTPPCRFLLAYVLYTCHPPGRRPRHVRLPPGRAKKSVRIAGKKRRRGEAASEGEDDADGDADADGEWGKYEWEWEQRDADADAGCEVAASPPSAHAPVPTTGKRKAANDETGGGRST
jgi:hypothetical protein